eukprot:1189016-Prorocentrum_minimum.AAC.6
MTAPTTANRPTIQIRIFQRPKEVIKKPLLTWCAVTFRWLTPGAPVPGTQSIFGIYGALYRALPVSQQELEERALGRGTPQQSHIFRRSEVPRKVVVSSPFPTLDQQRLLLGRRKTCVTSWNRTRSRLRISKR